MRPATPESIRRHRELTDAKIADAPLEDLRAAYRSLLDHHVAETTTLVSRRDDLARRCDVLVAENLRLADLIRAAREEATDP